MEQIKHRRITKDIVLPLMLRAKAARNFSRMIAINLVHQIGLQATMGRSPNRRKAQDLVQQLRFPAKTR
ncbi:hypothetical protein [Hoylesella timonensis]|uniref:hypothetical protein n=1 Tax=Hoylesella timonensis TaxID=386414 RepID=UPI000587D7B7|nr:hypothetical protein [Hoylesella timonensis]